MALADTPSLVEDRMTDRVASEQNRQILSLRLRETVERLVSLSC